MIRLTSLKAARNVRPAIGSAASIAEIIENRRRAEMVAEILFGLFGDRLEGAYAQMDAAQWNPDHHPRGKGGRFVAKGTAAEVDEAKKVVAKVLRGDTDVDPVDTGRHLSRLNVRQLRDLHREHGQKIRKTHLRQQIVDRVRETATGSQWYGQATQPKPQPAPAAMPATPADVAKEKPAAAEAKPKRITKEQYITKLQDIATRHVREFDAWKEANGAVGADNWKGPRPYAVSTAYVYHLGGVKNAEKNLARAEKEIVDSIEKFKADWNARRQAREADQAKEAAQAKPETMTTPTPAAGGFKPVAVPGEQMGLFSTEEVKTGQKQLFNIARDSKRGGGSAATPERSTLEKIADEHKQRSLDNAPLAGQKTIGGVSAFGGKSYDDLTDEQKRGNSHLMNREQKLAAIAERERQDAADEAYREQVRRHQSQPSREEIQRAVDSVQKLGNSYNPGGTHPGMYPTRAEAVAKAINSERAKAAGVGQGYQYVAKVEPAEIRQAIKDRPATPEQDRPADPIKTAAAIARINQKHGDGLTEADAVPASMQKPSDAAKSILRTTPKKKAAAEPRPSRSSAELADAAATLSRELKRSPATVEKTLRDALAFHTQSIAEREAAKAHARKVTGLNAGNLAKFENSMRDHSTAFNWDRKARAVAMEVPELGLDPDGHDTPAKVWDLIREGKAARPSANDPEVISTAREWLSKPRRPKTTPADVPADNGFDVVFGDAAEPTRVKRGRVKDSSGVGYVPFSRARGGGANRIGSALVAALAAGRLAKPPTLHAGRFRDMGTNVGICRLRAKSAKRTRTFKGVAYTGGVMHPSITIDGVTRAMDVVLDLDSLTIPSMVRPVLDDHDETTHGLIGQTRLIRREGQRLVIEGTLYGWKLRAKEIIAAARAGHQWQLSVGTDGFRLEDIPAGQRVTVNGQTFVGPVKVARGAYLTDFSFVAVGADDHTSAVIAASRGRRPRRPRRSERDEFCTVAT